MSFHVNSRPRSDYGFSQAQQGLYRPMVWAAWERHCALTNSPFTDHDSPSFRAWYEAELEAATGETSTTKLDRKRDFTDAMAHFEALVGESIFWQMRQHGDDARRIAFNLREIVQQNDVDEVYMRAMARRMLRIPDDEPLPELGKMTYEQLIIIMGELKRFLRRGGRPGVKQEALDL
jgi:hypothetical protein